MLQKKMGMLIDLTNTTRFYDSTEVEKKECRYVKMQCRGFVGFLLINYGSFLQLQMFMWAITTFVPVLSTSCMTCVHLLFHQLTHCKNKPIALSFEKFVCTCAHCFFNSFMKWYNYKLHQVCLPCISFAL